MTAQPSAKLPNMKVDLSKGVFKRLLQVGSFAALQAVILFAAAGRLDWVNAWALLGIYVGIVGINVLIFLSKNPELVAERGQIKAGANSWDKILGTLVGGLMPLVVLLVAGFDVRFGWSPLFAIVIELVALVFVVLGYGLFSWGMMSNKFFSGVVRIQKERGHTVATGGPYRHVRHPGYAAVITYSLATPLLLGSLWALIPAGLTVPLVIIRTVLKDRTLLNELEGYRDYAHIVRVRLLPGVW